MLRKGGASRVQARWRGNPILGPAMILPAVLGLALFQFLPLAVAIVNSLRSFNPFDQSPNGWVGFDNYVSIFSDPAFVSAFINTMIYIVAMLVITIPLALALALLLDRRLPGTIWMRAAVIGALAASEAVTALIWNEMYEPSLGLFNAVLNAIGLPKQPFLTSTTEALPSIVALTVWKDVGLPMLIFLAGLQALPSELREAAALDGAGAWRTFRSIVLPNLRPSILLALFMTTIAATRIFTPIQILTQGGPEGASSNLALYSYQQSFEFSSPGPASASVVCMLVLLAAVTVAQAQLLRDGKESKA